MATRYPGLPRLLVATIGFAALAGCAAPQPIVHTLAPGIGAQEIPLGSGPGCNQGWIETDTFVVVVDANVYPTGVRMIETVRAATDKPVRFVVDTHFHGDHTHGNGRWTALGADVIASMPSRESFARTEHDFRQARDAGDAAYRGVDFAAPTIWFDRAMTLGDGARRVDVRFLGAAHTPGDVVVWVPESGVLFAGDLVANGQLAYLGDADIESWIEVLRQLEQLPIRVVVPGHGPPGDLETIRRQRSFLTDLRDAVAAAREAGLTDADEIADTIVLPNHPLWSKQPRWFRRFGVRRLLP